MVLRPDAILQRLLKLEEVVSRLERLPSSDDGADPSDFRDEWAAERGLQLAAEIVFDVGNHILGAHFGTSASDYENVLTELCHRGVIERELRDRFAGLGGFRNILVHDYLRLDPARVADALRRAPRDFSAFADAIRTWLARNLG